MGFLLGVKGRGGLVRPGVRAGVALHACQPTAAMGTYTHVREKLYFALRISAGLCNSTYSPLDMKKETKHDLE